MRKIYVIGAILIFNACSNSDANLTIKNEPIQMANPASINCINSMINTRLKECSL
ncbi:MAG: hypothetical protein IE881_05960 [Epsilonproteobacteria bacterium]|nr:hypothetical protein [Campylobacterota bacterium]